jgi:hypothetical protein
MNYKTILALFGIVLFGTGLAMAISGATPTQVGNQYRWTGQSAANLTTEGGNITAANVSGTFLTDRWAAFFGNVSGTIVLGNNTSNVYSWTYNVSNGGEICLSPATAFSFATPAAAVPATLNTDFNLGSASDNATRTFTTTSCSLTFSTGTVSSLPNVTTTGGFNTCAVTDGSTGAKTNYAFCTAINSTGTNWLTNAAHYQVMVPTEPGSGTENYYFYMELN